MSKGRAKRGEFGELGIPRTFQVVGPRSRICTNPAEDVLLGIRKKNLSFEGEGTLGGNILYINSKSTRKPESAVAEIKHVSKKIKDDPNN